jgi:hypothetical protein
MPPKQTRVPTPGNGGPPLPAPKAKPSVSGPQGAVVTPTTPSKDTTLKPDHSPTAIAEHPTSNPSEHVPPEPEWHVVTHGHKHKHKGFPTLGHHIPKEWDVKSDIKDVKTFVETITSTTIDNVKTEASSEVHKITESVVKLVTHGNKDNHEYKDGVHFLDQLMVNFERDFLQWKMEHVFPKIQDWLKVIVAEHVQTLIEQRTKTIIKQFQEIITIVEKGYEKRLEEIEEAHRVLLIEIVEETWAAYRKKMEVEIVKEIRVRLAVEEEMDVVFSKIVQKVVPEIAKKAPKKYHPEVTMYDGSKVTPHSTGAVIHHTGEVLDRGEHHHVEHHSSEHHHVEHHSEHTTNPHGKQMQHNGVAN